MSHPALPRIESGLAGASAALLTGDFETMQSHLAATLDGLAEVTRAGLVPRRERVAAPWDEAQAERLVWELLAGFKAADCHVFPFAGTLLGLERDQRLLPNDKDADLAVWLEDYSLAARLLLQWGLQRATDTPPFANVAAFIEPTTGYTVDLFGLRRDAVRQRVEGGAWLYGKPASHQRLLVLPWQELRERPSPSGPVWWPGDPDALLRACYGDWRTRRAEWDSLVSNPALQETNLSWRCWALKSLVEAWLGGDLARTRRLMDQVLSRAGADAQLHAWRDALDAGLRMGTTAP